MKLRARELAPVVATLGALVAAAAGCAPPEPDDDADAVWGEATAVEELGIGVEDGPEEHMFGRVSSVAVAGDGTIYATDVAIPIVRAYDRDGSFLRNIGHRGQGPGEYARAPALRTLADGRLVMWDLANARVSSFSPDGSFLHSFPGSARFGGHRVLEVDLDGNLYLRTLKPAARSEADALLLQYSIEGEQLDRIDMPAQDAVGRTFYLGNEAVGAFQVMSLSAWSPFGYVVTGRNDAYDIELRKPGGTGHLRRDLQPIALEAEERAEWEAFRQGAVERSRAAGWSSDLEPDPVPAVKPFFRDILVGEDGRIWVFRYVAARKRDDVKPLPDRPERPLLTWREPWTYDVFESDGTFLGSVVVPELLVPLVLRSDRIWGTLLDAEGVQRVVRLRVVPGGG